MAVNYGKDTTRLWARLLNDHEQTYLQVRYASEDDRPELEAQLFELEEAILLTRAPNIGAIHHKLELLWQSKLHGNDLESQIRIRILGELRMEAWHTLSEDERMALTLGSFLADDDDQDDFNPGRDLLNPDWLEDDEPTRPGQANDD